MTVPPEEAKAAGVDTSRWGPLDMFGNKERFKQLDGRCAWVPGEVCTGTPEHNTRPQPGDILIMVSYPKIIKEVQRDMSRAMFQHIAILIEPVKASAAQPDTETWITADGGKGDSHAGEDKTGRTERCYDPSRQQFMDCRSTKAYEAAEGGRYLLGFWRIAQLPRRPEPKSP